MTRVEITEQHDGMRRIVGHVEFYEESGYKSSAGLPLSKSEIEQVARMLSRNFVKDEIGDYEWRVSTTGI